jgi:hypothetical protein
MDGKACEQNVPNLLNIMILQFLQALNLDIEDDEDILIPFSTLIILQNTVFDILVFFFFRYKIFCLHKTFLKTFIVRFDWLSPSSLSSYPMNQARI